MLPFVFLKHTFRNTRSYDVSHSPPTYSEHPVRTQQPNLYGHVIKNFVTTELMKLGSFGDRRTQLLHFRTSDNKEVDFVLERPDGSLFGIEVKSSATVKSEDFKGLKVLQEVSGSDFVGGIVLYTGTEVVPFGPQLLAVPMSSLWQ